MRILCTGAEGFVGSNLVPLLAKEHDVVALDYLVSREKSNLPGDINYINHDLSRVNIDKLPKVDLIIHLAAISIERVSESPVYADVNLASTFKIFEYVVKNKADLIFSSSGSVYGSGVGFVESDTLHPLSDYSFTKMKEENHAKFCSENYDLNVTILRYTNCYGDTTYIKNKFYPGKKDVIRMFVENMRKGLPLPVVKSQSRDFTFIDDVVSATRAVIGLKGFNVFNVGTGIETKIEDVARIVGGALGKQPSIKAIPPRKIDNVTRRSLNIDKISPLWKPKYSLEEGIKLYVERLKND